MAGARRILAAIWLLLAFAGGAAAQERIIAFDSRVVIAEDGELTVTETITVQAQGDRIRRGIYRDFPTVYRGRDGRAHLVGFKVVEVLRDGRPENWFTKNRSNGVRVYAGREDVYLRPGRYEYVFTYRTDRQIGFFGEYDELYWNVTGNDWDFAIERARVTIVLPATATILQTAAYTGRQGATGQDWAGWTDDSGNAVFETTRRLGPKEGLTVAIAWPKGIVAPPSAADELIWTLRGYVGGVAAATALLLVLVYYYVGWRRIGRDPEAGTVVPRWKPPKGVSPAAARFVAKMGFDAKAIGAAVVSLAVKGKLIIEDDGDDDFSLRKHDGGFGIRLSPGEKAMQRALFAWGDHVAIRKGNHTRLQPAVNALREALSADYEGAHFRRNLGYFSGGVVLSVLAAFGAGIANVHAAVGQTEAIGAGIIAVTVFCLFGVNLLFRHLIKAPTLEGRRIMDEIEGFRMYLSTAEQERLNLLHPPERTPALFEKYLPYAMALDVETEWGEQFHEVFATATADPDRGYQPRWYRGRRGYHGWASPGRFASALGASLGGAIASAATPPGSSSGSGGGGASGGGGGGGGGGGW
ncbi:MAG: DUF2207 domain-containing protein [Rhodospirillales bacterium]|nr:MAG: DUF2207 domain-containing protein [Rhodospirillales bacterium]